MLAGFLMTLGEIFYILVAALLIIVILLQEPRTGGLSSAFGGTGIDSVLGAGIGRKMSRLTIVLAVILFILAVILGLAWETPTVEVTAG
ncbi:MAG: preprotein translocase subunit SecG [Planctomycetota bacterium]|nr:MAG: preprotein translocase subunit SecG [Planctomycetota bacterium]